MYNIISSKIIPRFYLNVFAIECQRLESMQDLFKDFRSKGNNHKGNWWKNFYFNFLSLLPYLQNKFSHLMWMGLTRMWVFKNCYWGFISELVVQLQGRHQTLWDCKGWYLSHWHLSWDIGHDRNFEYLIRDVMKWNSHHPSKCCRVTLMLLS